MSLLKETNEKAPNALVKRINVVENVVNEDFELKQAYEKGLTVLYFFPAAYTGVCTDSTCALRDDMEEFKKLNANIYAVSVDGPFTLKRFAEDYNLNYDLLSDFNKEAIRAFRNYYEDFAGLKMVAKRSLFVIKDGVITHKWVTDNAGDFPPFEELKEILKNL